jgi:hypothetical protein
MMSATSGFNVSSQRPTLLRAHATFVIDAFP